MGIEENTIYGKVVICLKDLMDKKNITISDMSKLTKLKYDIVKKYYYGDCYQFDIETLSKFCFILKCDVSDILKYKSMIKC